MKNIIEPNGDVYLKDKDGFKQLVARIDHGVTFNLYKTKANLTSKVSIYNMGLTDEFFFYKNRPVFHHLQTRHLIPSLTTHYMLYFVGRDGQYSPASFLKYILKQYFKELGYEIPEEENNAS